MRSKSSSRPGWAWKALVIVAAASFGIGALPLGPGGPGAAQGGGRGAFTSEERALLESGGLVTRRRLEDRGAHSYFGGSAYQTIDRPLDEVWRAIRDPDHYRDVLPQIDEVRIVSRDPDEVLARFQHAYSIVHASYYLRIRYDEAAHDVTFDLDPARPHDVHAANGFMHLSRWPGQQSRTLVTWGILAAVENGFLGSLVRGQLHDWMLRVPSTMRSFLHGRGRQLFLADAPPAATPARQLR